MNDPEHFDECPGCGSPEPCVREALLEYGHELHRLLGGALEGVLDMAEDPTQEQVNEFIVNLRLLAHGISALELSGQRLMMARSTAHDQED